MLLCDYLNALESKHICVQSDAHSPTLRELRRSHHAYLNHMVITQHVNGRLHKAQVRTADWGVYLFTIRY